MASSIYSTHSTVLVLPAQPWWTLSTHVTPCFRPSGMCVCSVPVGFDATLVVLYSACTPADQTTIAWISRNSRESVCVCVCVCVCGHSFKGLYCVECKDGGGQALVFPGACVSSHRRRTALLQQAQGAELYASCKMLRRWGVRWCWSMYHLCRTHMSPLGGSGTWEVWLLLSSPLPVAVG